MEEKRDARGLTEAEAIARYKSKNYPKPALTADIAVFSVGEGIRVLLIERGGHPFLGRLALPGGFADENEPVEATAARELEEDTGVSGLGLSLVGIYSAPNRDPRGWVVSAAFSSVVSSDALPIRAGDDAADARWFLLTRKEEGIFVEGREGLVPLSELAFDHGKIVEDALLQLNLSL